MTSNKKLSLLTLIPESYVNGNSMNDFHCMTKGGGGVPRYVELENWVYVNLHETLHVTFNYQNG
jgi:hypothetical protein